MAHWRILASAKKIGVFEPTAELYDDVSVAVSRRLIALNAVSPTVRYAAVIETVPPG